MNWLRTVLVTLSVPLLITVAATPRTAHGECPPQWSAGRGIPGTDGHVNAAVSWDPDGPGGVDPVPVVGGTFSIAGSEFAANVAAWNGAEWTPLGTGIPGSNATVRALAVFDDGNGPALYAGGFFSVADGAPADFIAKWDGASWSSVGTGMDGRVEALTVFDDGDGPALYAGGGFLNAGGQFAPFIAKWDGSAWSGVGGGMNSWVLGLTVFDDGNGAALYAGGMFTVAGGVPARFAAKWDGASWTDLATFEVDGIIHDLVTYNDGGGDDLYVAGEFSFIGTEALANFVARWDGSSWTSLGNGVTDLAFALTVYDDGGGPELAVGGAFTSAGIVSASRIASWDGTDWSALGEGVDSTVTSLAVVEDGPPGAPASLYVGGLFKAAAGLAARGAAQWNGTAWSNLGTGMGLGGTVHSFVTYDDGSGPALHAAGGFETAGGVVAGHVAKWDTAAWSALEEGTNFLIYATEVFNDGSPGAVDALVVGGSFTTAGAAPATHIAGWNGDNWAPVGTGTGYIVRALIVFDDGDGPALFAGGAFTTAGGEPANYVAKWDGAAWSPLSAGMNNMVYVLAVFDDGSGPALFAGGEFTMAGGTEANHVAKWNGTDWTPLGLGANNAVYALKAFDDGDGPALYAGGFFTEAGGVEANYIAKWDGETWSAVGDGVGGHAFPHVFALEVFDDGDGPSLYAGGQFTTAGGASANNIARWDGDSWMALSSGLEGTAQPAVQSLTVFDDGTGPALYVGGTFTNAGGRVSAFWARWGSALGDFTSDGAVDLDDWTTFADCVEGPGSAGTSACDCADIDGDGDIDLVDMAGLQRLFR